MDTPASGNQISSTLSSVTGDGGTGIDTPVAVGLGVGLGVLCVPHAVILIGLVLYKRKMTTNPAVDPTVTIEEPKHCELPQVSTPHQQQTPGNASISHPSSTPNGNPSAKNREYINIQNSDYTYIVDVNTPEYMYVT